MKLQPAAIVKVDVPFGLRSLEPIGNLVRFKDGDTLYALPKDHEIAQLVNEITDCARLYHSHDCLREVMSQLVVDFLKPQLNTEKI